MLDPDLAHVVRFMMNQPFKRREIIKPQAHEYRLKGLMIAAVMAGSVMDQKDTSVSIWGIMAAVGI